MFNFESHLRAILQAFGKIMPGYYAVKHGRNPGIYRTWAECEAEVKGFSNAKYKKFATEEAALSFIHDDSSCSTKIQNVNQTKNKKTLLTNASSLCHYTNYAIKETNEQIEAKGRSLKRKLSDAFKTDKDDESVHIYTDGACCSNGRKEAKAGIGVYWGPNHPLNVSERLPGRQTNNRAEIHAAVKALQQAKENGITNVTIYTDSNFLIKSITKWIITWKRNGWKLSTGEPVKNRIDFEALEIAMKGLAIKWVHVRGHQGIPGNEAADHLAVQSLDKAL